MANKTGGNRKEPKVLRRVFEKTKRKIIRNRKLIIIQNLLENIIVNRL